MESFLHERITPGHALDSHGQGQGRKQSFWYEGGDHAYGENEAV
jgi:hypothetical protein